MHWRHCAAHNQLEASQSGGLRPALLRTLQQDRKGTGRGPLLGSENAAEINTSKMRRRIAKGDQRVKFLDLSDACRSPFLPPGKLAGIEYEDSLGEVILFHSLPLLNILS